MLKPPPTRETMEADGVSEPLLEEFARRDVAALFETVPRQITADSTVLFNGKTIRIGVCLRCPEIVYRRGF
jgi:hypothetical protein